MARGQRKTVEEKIAEKENIGGFANIQSRIR